MTTTIIIIYWIFSSGFCVGMINFGIEKHPLFYFIMCLLSGWLLMPIVIGSRYTTGEP